MENKWIKRLNMVSVPLQMLGVCVLYFVIEWISRHSFMEAWEYMTQRPWVFLYNSFLIFTTTLLVYLTRRRVFARVFLGVFWLFLGIVNGFLLSQRVTPFTGPDLKLLSDAFGVMNKYLPGYAVVVVGILMALVVLGIVLLLIKGPKYKGPMKYRYNIIFVLVGVLLFAGATKLALEKRVLSNYFGNIAFAYEDYGYPYCLVTTIFNTGISEPMDYSDEKVQEIQDSTDDLSITTANRPNIIFLQLESFFDPTLVNYLELSEDPIPYFRQLMSEYSSGYFRVPSVGAGTANTEFETITGMSLRYFGPGEYPYKSILKESTCESVPYVLSSLGYTTHAIHNNEANFYGRRTVFANLGFETFTSAEYMEEQDNTTPTNWIKDEILTRYIMECLEFSDGSDYIYTISVQGHGDYPEEPILEDPKITVTGGETDAVNNKWEYYVNQINEMDNFIRELTETLAAYDEDVVLVMYGDHLPTMGLTVSDLENRYLFQTNYVIWDNMGLEKEDENLASYQIAAEVLDRVGIHRGNIIRYHQARRSSKDYQVDLEMLQYDILYGEKYVYKDNKSPYKKVKLQLGTKDVSITGMEQLTENSWYIYGTNFTPSAWVEVNKELKDTTYISPTQLLLTNTELEHGDKVDVAIRSNSSTAKVLTRSRKMTYREPIKGPFVEAVPEWELEIIEDAGSISQPQGLILDMAEKNLAINTIGVASEEE